MANELITRDSAAVKNFFLSLEKVMECVESMVSVHRPTFGGERFLTDKEVSVRLKVSRRTLQEYRTTGKVSYHQLGGKILYRESDIERLLNDHYISASE
jgi:excisionase family DNA binding protein